MLKPEIMHLPTLKYSIIPSVKCKVNNAVISILIVKRKSMFANKNIRKIRCKKIISNTSFLLSIPIYLVKHNNNYQPIICVMILKAPTLRFLFCKAIILVSHY